MVIFLDALVTVADGSLRYIIDMVGIGEAIVVVVMTDGRDTDWKGIHLAQLCILLELTLSHKDIAHLKHIHRMHIVVVLHFAIVALEDFANKVSQLSLIQL